MPNGESGLPKALGNILDEPTPCDYPSTLPDLSEGAGLLRLPCHAQKLPKLWHRLRARTRLFFKFNVYRLCGWISCAAALRSLDGTLRLFDPTFFSHHHRRDNHHLADDLSLLTRHLDAHRPNHRPTRKSVTG